MYVLSLSHVCRNSLFLQLVPQLLSFPIGTFWASCTPNISVFGIQLNPGPFSVKEHVLITIMGSVGAVSAYGTDIIAVQRVFYGKSRRMIHQDVEVDND